MKKWGRRRSAAKEERRPAEIMAVTTPHLLLLPPPSSKEIGTDATTEQWRCNFVEAKESPTPDLSNLWSRKQSIEGGETKNNRSALYPIVREIHVPPTEDILTKRLPYALQNKEDKVKPGVVSVKSAPQQAKQSATPSSETKPGAVAVAGSGFIPQQAKKEEDDDKTTTTTTTLNHDLL